MHGAHRRLGMALVLGSAYVYDASKAPKLGRCEEAVTIRLRPEVLLVARLTGWLRIGCQMAPFPLSSAQKHSMCNGKAHEQ